MSQSIITDNKSGIFPYKTGDKVFIIALPAVAIMSGVFVSFYPDYFLLVLLLDLWLLGYHHVISTFTRIGLDAKSAKENWLFLLPLPLIVFVSVFAIYQLGGAIVLGSLYLYWQWYHYSRQSEGIAKSYALKCPDVGFASSTANRILFYLVPMTSFLYMVSGGPDEFLGIPIFTIALNEQFRWLLLALSYAGALFWLINGTKALFEKRISAFYFLYMLSHFSVYLVSYVVITEINYSWLTINIWHNAQYIAFVWLFNRKKYAAGVEKEHLLVSFISQPNRLFIYLGSCLILSLAVYWVIDQGILYFASENKISLVFIVYSAINFHHYIVDSQIWKLRKPQVKNTLTQ
jgi:hypothetical protein